MINKKLPSFLNMYKDLIKTSSISSIDNNIDQSNENLINLLAIWFNDIGFNVEINQLPNNKKKFNLLAMSNKNNINGLLLVGHTDTVPYYINQWKHDPFILKEYNNKLYGLGVVDMKGFFVFILESLRYINIKKFKQPLHILATADEETTMDGAKFFVKSTKLKPDYAIIGEPTSLQPVYSHKGYLCYSFIVNVESGHSSDPSNKMNAIDIMFDVIKNLINLRHSFKKKYFNKNFTIPYSTMNFGYIHGGNAPNIICPHCELQIDIRPLPNLILKDIYSMLNKTLKMLKKKYKNNLLIKELYPHIPSFECNKDHKLIKIIEKISNKTAITANYVTEASFIQKLCPTIIFGPGNINQAHQPDEFIDISFIIPTLIMIKKIIKYFCCLK